jgi:phosphoglycerate dehydrogenase-like enzyme
MDQSFVIWCNVKVHTPESSGSRLLRDALAGHMLHMVDGATPPALSRSLFDEASIAFGQPPVDALLASQRVRWAEISSAGYEAYDRVDLREALAERKTPLTNAGSVYADACAQHALAMMLAACREFPLAIDAQHAERWAFAELRPRMQLLSGQSVVILGWGRIARRLVELLTPFGLRVTAVRRHVVGDEPVPVITTGDLDAALARADHLVNLLPGGSGTARFVDEARLSRLPKGAFFYNVGRGSTVDQNALIAGLDSGHLGAAWLDVTDPEPLPPDHPLWRTPRCHITPHLAGGQANERERLVRHFLDNFQRFTAGDPLVDRIL